MKRIILGLVALCGLDASMAIAQTSGSTMATPSSGGYELDEVVVTAQKRAQNLQDVPLAVSAASGAELADAGVVNTQDLKVAFAGVNIRTTSSYFQPSIRGISTSSINVENPDALYIDGVYYASQRDATRDLNDIAQISVLKGPQGTLFGRNATGGVIQITTDPPSHTFSGHAGVNVDNYGTVRTDVYATGGLSDTLAGSIAGNYVTQDDGWGRNVTTGKDTFKIYHIASTRGKLLFQPGADTDVTVIADYMDRRDSLGAYFSPYPGTTAGVPGYVATPSVYDSDVDFDSRNFFKGGGVSVNIEQRMAFAKFTSISAFREFTSGYTLDADMVPTLNYNVDTHTHGKTVTQEFQLASVTSESVNWTVGAFYYFGLNQLSPEVDTLGGEFSPVPPYAVEDITHGSERTNSGSPFGQIEFTILPDTHFTVGTRWTYEKRSFEAEAEQAAVADSPAVFANPRGSEVTFEKATWRAALDHKFNDDVMAYVSFNRGFKSGGYNIANPFNPSYAPEQLDAYEIGMKTEALDHRLRINTAAFYYNYQNIQVVSFQDFQNIIVNGAKAALYGIDTDLEMQVAQGLRVNAGLELLHSEFKSFPNAPISTPSDVFGATVTAGDATGNRLPLAQNVNANVSMTYTRNMSFGKLEFNATENHNGNYFFESDNVTKQNAYDLVNLSANWTPLNSRFTAGLFVHNLLDKKVISQASALAYVGYVTTYDNPPRLYGASFKMTF